MAKHSFVVNLLALISILIGPSVSASSITEDLADCAQGVAIDSLLKAKMAAKAAEFAAFHSDCIPLVSAGDPVLIGMTGGILGLQAMQPARLSRDADMCTEEIFSVAQKPIAGMIDTTMNQPGLSSIIPSSSRAMLHNIATGASNEALYSVPGMTIITSKLTCGCAVAETGVPVETLKETVENGLKTINSCSGVVTKLLGGAYSTASSGAEAVLAAATEIYTTAQNAIKSLGCGWLWSCPSPPSGPPFFCTGYSLVRARGGTVDGIRAQYDELWKMVNGGTQQLSLTQTGPSWTHPTLSTQEKELPPNPYSAAIDTCEKQFVEEADRITRDLALADAAAKAEAEGSNYALAYFLRWLPQCQGDQICSNGMGGVSNLYYADIKDPDIRAYFGKNSPDPFRATVKGLNEKYRANAQILVYGARDRRYQALRDNPTAPPKDRLVAFGCNPFLGRDRQSLCTSNNNMAVCKQYVMDGRWNFCATALAPGAYFSAGRPLTRFVQSSGCILLSSNAGRSASSIETSSGRGGNGQLSTSFVPLMRAAGTSTSETQRFQCLSPAAWRACKAFQNGGSPVDCGPARALTLAMQRPLVTTPIATLDNIGAIQGGLGLGTLQRSPALRRAPNPSPEPTVTPPMPPAVILSPVRRLPALKKSGS
jgi:hypothetical protein